MFYHYSIFPIENFLSILLSLLHGVTGSYLLALILLSVVVRLITTPFEKLAHKSVMKEHDISSVLAPQIARIKIKFKGGEKHEAIKRLYGRYGYHPVYAVRSMFGLLVQLPFFLAAYYMIGESTALQGVIVPLIGDLGQPDSLLFGTINLLPFVMTGVNLAALYSTPDFNKKKSLQGICIALFFLILLYNLPAALLIYWTTNNLFSLCKNLLSITPGAERLKINSFLKTSILASLTICLIMFFLTPSVMIAGNTSAFSFIDLVAFFKTASMFSLILIVFLLSVTTLCVTFKQNNLAVIFLEFILFWTFFSGLFFPTTMSTGMVELKNNPIDTLNVFITLSLTIFSIYLTFTKAKKILYTFFFIAIVYTAFTVIITINKAEWPGTENASSTDTGVNVGLQLSNIKNILVISFDGLSGEVVKDIIKSDEKFSSTFKDFIFYENAVSQSPATVASLMGEIYGIHNYKKFGKNVQEVHKNIKGTDIYSSLLSSNIDDVYHFHYPLGKRLNLDQPLQFSLRKAKETFDFFDYPIARICSPLLFHPINLLKKKFRLSEFVIDDKEKLLANNDKGPSWDKKEIETINNCDYLLENLEAVNKGLCVRRAHFTFTHFPVNFDQECNFKSDDKEWFLNNQNETGMRNETKGAVSKFVEFIKKIKELGIYNQSLIVLKSDHGKPVGYQGSPYFDKKPNNLKINGHAMWGYSRYRPLLMIKDFNHQSDKISFEQQLVLLNDLAITLCEKSGVIDTCNNLPGINLLAKDFKDKDSSYYIYVAPDNKASHDYESHIEIKIESRKDSLLDAMKRNPSITLSNGNTKY